MNLELNNEYIVEVFEILCDIPFEKAIAEDTEPPTKRHQGIEQLIKQLDAEMSVQAETEIKYMKLGE